MPATTEMVAHFVLKLDGSDAPAELAENLAEVVVETNLLLPAMCTAKFYDKELRWVDATQLKVGTEIEVQVQASAETESQTIFKGEITALEPEFNQSNVVMQVRAFDKGHRLHRGRRQANHRQVTDSDLASKLAQESGLNPTVGSTSEVYEQIFQNNQTNWELLQERARRIGFICYVDGDDLHFDEPSSQGQVDLQWGEELIQFRPRLSSAGQVTEVIVRGWDPQSKEAIEGRATTGQAQPSIGESASGGETTEGAFGSGAKMVLVDRPVHTQGEADRFAQSIADELSGDYIRAEGQTTGNARIKAGTTINIAAAGDRFNGEYLVTRATHLHAPGKRYTVQFSVSGRRPLSVVSLLAESDSTRDSRVPGVVVGIVTNNNDPDGLGRIKVKLPWMSDALESSWARQAAPMAGSGRGFYYLPEVNDEVLVAFEHNDINYPYIIGALWNGQDKPPEENAKVISSSGEIQQRIIKTRVGHLIILDDSNESPGISIIDKTGKNKILIDSSGNKITIVADSDIDMTASMGKITISGQQGVEITSTQAVDIKGQTGVNVKGDAGVKVESSANVEVKAGAIATIKGSMVNIN